MTDKLHGACVPQPVPETDSGKAEALRAIAKRIQDGPDKRLLFAAAERLEELEAMTYDFMERD